MKRLIEWKFTKRRHQVGSALKRINFTILTRFRWTSGWVGSGKQINFTTLIWSDFNCDQPALSLPTVIIHLSLTIITWVPRHKLFHFRLQGLTFHSSTQHYSTNIPILVCPYKIRPKHNSCSPRCQHPPSFALLWYLCHWTMRTAVSDHIFLMSTIWETYFGLR